MKMSQSSVLTAAFCCSITLGSALVIRYMYKKNTTIVGKKSVNSKSTEQEISSSVTNPQQRNVPIPHEEAAQEDEISNVTNNTIYPNAPPPIIVEVIVATIGATFLLVVTMCIVLLQMALHGHPLLASDVIVPLLLIFCGFALNSVVRNSIVMLWTQSSLSDVLWNDTGKIKQIIGNQPTLNVCSDNQTREQAFSGNSVQKTEEIDELEKRKIVEEIEQMFDTHQYLLALNTLDDIKLKNGNKTCVEWEIRIAKACSTLGEDETNNNAKRELLEQGLTAATLALELDENNWEAHKWVGILTGSVSEFRPIKQKLSSAYDVKNHILKAIALHPTKTDATSFHALGRWYFALSELTWIERKAASTLFGSVPEASFEQALEQFEKAHAASEPTFWCTNALFVARSMSKLGRKDDACEWYRKIIAKRDETIELPEAASNKTFAAAETELKGLL